MLDRRVLVAIALAGALCAAVADAQAFDDALYPDWNGGWARLGRGYWDPTKPRGLGQQAPLTPEYQALFEASISDQKGGGQGNDAGYRCRPHGMPRIMIGNHPIVFTIMPETIYVMRDVYNQFRRIYTDGRDFPTELPHSTVGYSIGKWLDQDGDGHYDTLLVETRGLKNPRSYDSSGIPFHQDEATVIKERIFLDKGNRDLLHNEITSIDNALTRPWTVTRNYHRDRNPKWLEYYCSEDNHHAVIGQEDYLVSGDGFLMPVRKGQKPPDLRYFDQQ
ncbi:MAG: hypothetical protein QOI12_4298 [Alphaproteobacteria bacterium]|jgi:hypothetical protein|nr:hypothetical protein [Alphaproteobacteria bacterium]